MPDVTANSGQALKAALQGNRHVAVKEAAQWLIPNPNLTGKAKDIAEEYADFACYLLDNIKDGPQLTHALNELVRSKDHAVRAILPSPITG
jgi:hypothetical protein